MIADAKANAEQDKVTRELAEAKNLLDGMRLQAEKTLNETESATDEQKKPVQDAIEEAAAALESNDKDRIEASAKDIGEKLQAFMQATEAAAPAAEGAEAQPAADGEDDDDVIDADFKPAN